MGSDLSALDQHRYLSLATFRRSGAEVRTPVWFAATGGQLYVFTAADSGKIKRLKRSPRARIAPSDMRGNVRDEWRDARARIVTDAVVIERAHQAMRTKYGWQLALTDLASRLTGRIRTRTWIELADRGTAPGGA